MAKRAHESDDEGSDNALPTHETKRQRTDDDTDGEAEERAPGPAAELPPEIVFKSICPLLDFRSAWALASTQRCWHDCGYGMLRTVSSDLLECWPLDSVARLGNVRELRMKYSRATVAVMRADEAVLIATFTRLEALTIYQSNARMTEKFLSGLTTLRSLAAFLTASVTTAALTCLTNLERLRLSACQMSRIYELTDGLSCLSRLTALDIRDYGLGSTFPGAGMSNLTLLRVDERCGVTDDDLLRLTALRTLEMRHITGVTDTSVFTLTNLTNLSLIGNGIRVTHWSILTLSALVKLKMNRCEHITDEFEAFHGHLPSLTDLYVDQPGSFNLDRLRHFTQLRTLKVACGTAFSTDGPGGLTSLTRLVLMTADASVNILPSFDMWIRPMTRLELLALGRFSTFALTRRGLAPLVGLQSLHFACEFPRHVTYEMLQRLRRLRRLTILPDSMISSPAYDPIKQWHTSTGRDLRHDGMTYTSNYGYAAGQWPSTAAKLAGPDAWL